MRPLSTWLRRVLYARNVLVAVLGLSACAMLATWIGQTHADGERLRPYVELVQRIARDRPLAERQVLARVKAEAPIAALEQAGRAALGRLLDQLRPAAGSPAVAPPDVDCRVELPVLRTLREVDAVHDIAVHHHELAVDMLVEQLGSTFDRTWQTRIAAIDREPGSRSPKLRIEAASTKPEDRALVNTAIGEALTKAGVPFVVDAEAIEFDVPGQGKVLRLPHTAAELLADLQITDGDPDGDAKVAFSPGRLVGEPTWERVADVDVDKVLAVLSPSWTTVTRSLAQGMFAAGLVAAAIYVHLLIGLRRRILAAADRLPSDFALRGVAPTACGVALAIAAAAFVMLPATPPGVRVAGAIVAIAALLVLHPAARALRRAASSRQFEMEGFVMHEPRSRRSPRAGLWLLAFLTVGCAWSSDLQRAKEDIETLRRSLADLTTSIDDPKRGLRQAHDALAEGMAATTRRWSDGLHQRLIGDCTRALGARVVAEPGWSADFPAGWEVLRAAFPGSGAVSWEEAMDEPSPAWNLGSTLPIEVQGGQIVVLERTRLLRVKSAGAMQGMLRLRWLGSDTSVERASFAAAEKAIDLDCTIEQVGNTAAPLRVRITLRPGEDGNRLRTEIAVAAEGNFQPAAKGLLRAVD